MEASALLCKLLLQDIERRPDGVAVQEGVSQDRIVSVHDPEMRHGRKSRQHRFDGHKASVGRGGREPVDHGRGGAARQPGGRVCETVADAATGTGPAAGSPKPTGP